VSRARTTTRRTRGKKNMGMVKDKNNDIEKKDKKDKFKQRQAQEHDKTLSG
jgi:hypothetical protein